MEIQKRCKYCGRSFIAHKMTTIYCSPSCNNKDYKRAIRQKQIADYCEAHPEDKEDTPKDVLHGKAFLTPREAAKLLGIGKSSVYRELASGLIKAVQMKGKTLTYISGSFVLILPPYEMPNILRPTRAKAFFCFILSVSNISYIYYNFSPL